MRAIATLMTGFGSLLLCAGSAGMASGDAIGLVLFVPGALLTILGLILIAATPRRPEPETDTIKARIARGEMKVCPSCGNIVLATVSLCPQCGIDIRQIHPRLVDLEEIEKKKQKEDEKIRREAFEKRQAAIQRNLNKYGLPVGFLLVVVCILSILVYFYTDFKKNGIPGICVPTLVSPENKAIMDNGCEDYSDEEEWSFDWSDCPNATQYHLHVIGSSAWVPVIDDDTISASSYTKVGNSYVIETHRFGWRWKVRAKVKGFWGRWSDIRVFDVEPLNTDCR